jgi:hypothetical protein
MHRFLTAITALGDAAGVDATALMSERGEAVTRTCRLLCASDGWLAVNLARPDDIEAIPAWLQEDVGPDDLAAVIARRGAADVVDRARLLGLAAAVLGERAPPPLWHGLPVRATRLGDSAPLARPPRIANWSSLWAGPLCARILAARGAAVIESGAVVDVDVVIEGSRPRAFEQRGIDAEAVVRAGPQVWLSITGHGRGEPERNWIGFGDDCAVAGGLVTSTNGAPAFFADAAADPLTGITAAAAVTTALALGGRWLIDCNLAGVAAHVAR